jgi:polysaccharide export outer membrane protein
MVQKRFLPGACTPIGAMLAVLFVFLGAASALGGCRTSGEIVEDTEVLADDVRPVIGPGDVMSVNIFGEPDLSGEHHVSSDGTIRLPLVGTLPVSGLTAEEANERVAAAYNAEFLKNAQVSIFIKAFNSRRVYVLGAVKNPGPVAYSDYMTVLAAVSMAGGPSRIADANRSVLTREQENGEKLRMRVAVADIGKGTAQDIELKPGDIIFVPESLF